MSKVFFKTVFSFLLLCYAVNVKADEDVCAGICSQLLGRECIIGDLPSFITDPAATQCLGKLSSLTKDRTKIVTCANANASEPMAGAASGFVACLQKN